jgi:hypothetical protein
MKLTATVPHLCYSYNMASKKIVKPNYQGSLADYKKSLKPTSSKKEKLYGQELGKIGRAAERGGPVNTVQKKMGAYSEQVMQNKANRDMPVKRKVQEMGLQLGVAALTNPNTLRGVTNKLGEIRSAKYEYVVHTNHRKNHQPWIRTKNPATRRNSQVSRRKANRTSNLCHSNQKGLGNPRIRKHRLSGQSQENRTC